MTHNPVPKRVATFGTRTVLLMPDGTYRVACSTCNTQAPAVHTRGTANVAAQRDSKKPCPQCKAALLGS